MDPHVHTPIAEMLFNVFIVQYNPQFNIPHQSNTDVSNDQLSAADTDDYSDLPDLEDE